MGHDGPGHIAIAQEQPTLRALKLYHGKRGAGLSVELKVRYGPVTIVGCTQTADGRAEAARRPRASRSPATTFRIGNTNSRLRFALAAGRVLRALVRRGPDAPRRARRRPRRGRGAQGRVAARARVRRGGLRWSASASCCGCGPSGSTSTSERHRAVWPEMLDALRATGWGNYSLFLRDGRAAGRLPRDRGLRGGGRRRWRRPTSTRAGRRRWREFFELPSGERPDTGCERLEEVFHLD